MRPIRSLLQSESPLNLTREALWRARKWWRRSLVQAALQGDACGIHLRRVGYYRADPQSCSPQSRHTILGISDLLLEGRFPFLGYGTVALGIPPNWNCDFVSGKFWQQVPASRIQIIRHDGSDVKAPWELSRLQFLPVLAKAHLLSGEERYRDTAETLLSLWIDQNPVGIGVNWTMAMEAALRAISICLLMDLLWPFRPDERLWVAKVTRSLWQHLLYIEAHLEFSHFARSNHYLSNLLGLFCLSTFLNGPGMERRRRRYQRRIEEEIFHQTYADGGDYEASTGYHVLVTQMFTCALLLLRGAGVAPSTAFTARLREMYKFAAALADAEGRIPHVGDCDDGRVEVLLDDLEQMLGVPVTERDSLAISNFLGTGAALLDGDFGGRFEDAAWYGLAPSRRAEKSAAKAAGRGPANTILFPQSGVAIARLKAWEVIFFAIPNGAKGKGSHTHNDKLSFVLRLNGQELLGDSGTGVYTRDWAARNGFRATAAHNTLVIDGVEQNRISSHRDHLFFLGNEAAVTSVQCKQMPDRLVLRASHSGYSALQVTHARRLELSDTGFAIEDTVEGIGGHDFELNLHLSPGWNVETQRSSGKVLTCRLVGPSSVWMEVSAAVPLQLDTRLAPISRSYGSSFLATCLCVRGRATAPLTILTQITCSGESKDSASKSLLPVGDPVPW